MFNLSKKLVLGSYKCRAGWAYDAEPKLVFKSLVAKQRGKKEDVQVGNDITNIEVVKWQLKSQFDRNIVTQYDIQVNFSFYIHISQLSNSSKLYN